MPAPLPTVIEHWSGTCVEAWPSKGSGVLYLSDVRDNLVLAPSQIEDWQHTATTIKKLGDAARKSWFDPVSLAGLASNAPTVSRLQSIRSEDAVTWSSFGSLQAATPHERGEFLAALLWLAGSPLSSQPTDCRIELWHRYPHPVTGKSSHGPEADVMLIADDVVVSIEAKWGASEGSGQGVGGAQTQLDLRVSTAKQKAATECASRAVVIGIAPARHPLIRGTTWYHDQGAVEVRACSWQAVGALPHPQRDEILAQLAWRLNYV